MGGGFGWSGSRFRLPAHGKLLATRQPTTTINNGTNMSVCKTADEPLKEWIPIVCQVYFLGHTTATSEAHHLWPGIKTNILNQRAQTKDFVVEILISRSI